MKCNKCLEGDIIIKLGKYGLFAACNNFPNCRNIQKLSKFIYEVLKKDGIYIYGWDYQCWKCNKTTRVYTYFLQKQLKPYMDKNIEIGNLGLESIHPIDEYLKNNYSTININYSNTLKCYTVSNNCSHCGALIGNHYVVDDPHEVFNKWLTEDMHEYIVEKIPFAKIKLTEKDFTGLEEYFTQIC